MGCDATIKVTAVSKVFKQPAFNQDGADIGVLYIIFNIRYAVSN